MAGDVLLYECDALRFSRWISIKFAMKFMPFESNPKSYFLVFYTYDAIVYNHLHKRNDVMVRGDFIGLYEVISR